MFAERALDLKIASSTLQRNDERSVDYHIRIHFYCLIYEIFGYQVSLNLMGKYFCFDIRR